MIHHHETISLYGLPLFTKISLQTPLEEMLMLPSEACFAYIVNGDGHALAKEESIMATPGQVILSLCGLTVGKMISEQAPGHVESVVVHFQREQLQRVYENSKPPKWTELESPVTEYIIQSAASELVKHYFSGVIQLFEHMAAVTEDILELKLKEIVLLLLQSDNSMGVRKIMQSLFSERTFSFREIVDAHVCLPVTVEQLASLTNNSLSTFKREFKKIYNASPAAYLVEKRTEKVASLLKVSDEPISAIGYECGFSSPEHVSRAFKNKYGITPTQYRLNQSDK